MKKLVCLAGALLCLYV